ncbi:MAG: AMP-dependent synthetase/ligase [Streptosporangiales bacterium]
MSEQLDPRGIRQASSVCELFQRTVEACPDGVALRDSDGAVRLTWREYGRRVRSVAAGIPALGVGRGDTVALMLTNRPEFHLVDTAAFHLGAVPFSVYNTNPAEQISYLFRNAGNRVVVCEHQFLTRIRAAAAGSAVERIVCLDAGAELDESVTTLAELEAAGDSGFDFDAAWRAVEPGDLVTLIYTSGTTGPPKGVEITHANIVFSMGAALETPAIFDSARHGRVISYLPDAHLANRYFAHYLPIAVAGTTTCVADLKSIVSVLPEVRPTAFLGVPAIWYKLKAGIERDLAARRGLTGVLARWALDVGLARVRCETARRTVPPWLRIRHALADRLVLSRIRAKLGLDRCAVAVSGSAPVAVEALQFLMSVGIPVCEGWAMTESSVHGTLNPRDAVRPGSVGKPMYGVEARIADDGELLVRSAAVMKGYRNDPTGTAETVDADGWLHTGDLATIDDEGYVSIVDRKKELIINAAGKNMSPTNIEDTVKVACPLIGSVVAIGDRRPYVVTLITLDADAVGAFVAERGLAADPAVLAADPQVNGAVAAAVRQANAQLSRVEQVKDFTLLPVHWDPGGDELTPTMKLKRAPIAKKYAAEIDALYDAYSESRS